jgi:hypothetical protein
MLPRNSTAHVTPMLMIYTEQTWQDAYFFTGDCFARERDADHAAMAHAVGGNRLFRDMDVGFTRYNRALGNELGNGSFVTFSERLVLQTKAFANVFIALRWCIEPLLLPMSVEVRCSKAADTLSLDDYCFVVLLPLSR